MHEEFVELALELITEDGRRVDFIRKGTAPAAGSKPWQGTSGLSSETVTIPNVPAVFVPFRGFEFGSEFLDVKMYKEVSEICLVPNIGVDLEGCHGILDEGREFRIEWIQRLRPGTTTVLYAFGVNR